MVQLILMRKKRKGLLESLSLLILLSACEEAVDWPFKPLENGHLAVEAIVTDEWKPQEVFLSLSYDEPRSGPAPATGATVQLSGGGETVGFAEDPGRPGQYVSTRPFAAGQAYEYTLEIEWDGQVYEARSRMVDVLPMPTFTFSPSEGTDSLTIGNPPPVYSPNEQAMYEIAIDWSHLNLPGPAQARLYFFTFNTIDVSGVFKPTKETVTFPRGSIVIVKKYGLDPAFAVYLRALMLETEWQGGVFDEASSSLPTNISNGGLGFFAVCAVRSDTLIAR